MNTKPVTVRGMVWQCISRNERVVTHEGQHFYACRCHVNANWMLETLDRDITTAGLQAGATTLRTFTDRFTTKQLSDAVRDHNTLHTVLKD